MPYCEYSDDYYDVYNEILACPDVNEGSKKYIKNRHQYRHKWVKSYMKDRFTGGTCTNSRIESKHSVYKHFLNSDTSLMNLYTVFKTLEKQEIEKFKEEIQRFGLNDENSFKKYELLKELDETYCPYAMNKIKSNIMEALNYGVEYKPSRYNFRLNKNKFLGIII